MRELSNNYQPQKRMPRVVHWSLRLTMAMVWSELGHLQNWLGFCIPDFVFDIKIMYIKLYKYLTEVWWVGLSWKTPSPISRSEETSPFVVLASISSLCSLYTKKFFIKIFDAILKLIKINVLQKISLCLAIVAWNKNHMKNLTKNLIKNHMWNCMKKVSCLQLLKIKSNFGEIFRSCRLKSWLTLAVDLVLQKSHKTLYKNSDGVKHAFYQKSYEKSHEKSHENLMKLKMFHE